jgi:cytochrome c
MTFAGLSKPEDRANVIAYLNKQSDAPQPMPAAPAADAAPAAPAAGKDAAPAAAAAAKK